ncbi:MAG: DUF3419 family protein [Bacilli bacterium]|nr:DUF3419 family protein [Bacilli bacterium]
MNKQQKKDIEMTKDFYRKLILNYNIGNSFETYSKVYSFTNENLAKLYPLMHFEKYNSALTVLSSGDHAFNLIYMGVDKVDTFDTNRLTEYYALGFKKTAIECLSYQEFMNMFQGLSKISSEYFLEMMKFVIENMDKKYKEFFGEFYEFITTLNYHNYLIKLFRNDTKIADRDINNLYLQSANAYQLMQQRLEKAKITFKKCDAKNLTHNFQTYDLIDMSNVLASMRKISFYDEQIDQRISNIIKYLYKNNLNNNGTLLVEYGYHGILFCENILAHINLGQQAFYRTSCSETRGLVKK